MQQQYRLFILIATAAFLTGCASLPFTNPQPTSAPFVRFSAQDVFDAFADAGLSAENPERQISAGRDDPGEFSDRYVFEIPRIAPAGGQIVVFDDPQDLAAWEAYIERLRNDSTTRRGVVYVYVNGNVMLQLNNALTANEANAYRQAFEGMIG